MSDPHQKDIVPIRTFADDIKRFKKDNGSTDTTTSPIADEAVTEETEIKTSEPAKQPDITPVPSKPTEPPSMSGKGIEKSAFDYLVKSKQPDPTAKTISHRSTPVIKDTDVSLAVEKITNNNKMTVLHDEGLVNVDDDLYSGTIIQDKKRDNWKLVPAMGHAVTDWYKDKEKEFVESRQPTHTITKSEARINTIKEAAKASKRAPSADYQTVAEKLSAQEYEVDHAGIQVKDAAEVPPPSWTYTVEEESSDLSAAEQTTTTNEPSAKTDQETTDVVGWEETPATIKVDEMTKKAEPATISNEMKVPTTEVNKSAAQIPEPTPQTRENVQVQPAEVPVSSMPKTETRVAAENEANTDRFRSREDSIDVAAYLSTTPVTEAGEIKQSNLPTTAAVNQKQNELPKVARAKLPNPTQIPLYVFVVGFLAVCLMGVGVSLYLFTTANEQPVIVEETTLEPLVKAKTVKLSIDPTQESIIDRLAISSEREGTNVYEFTTTGNNPLTPAQIVANFVPHEVNSLARNTENISIGFTEQERPYMIIKGDNFETLFGGLLSWEATMNRDLAPLFGPDLKLTPRVITGNQIDDSHFTDEVLMNQTARVLYDYNDQESLIYAFVDRTTVIIATDRSDIINLIPMLK